MRIASVHTTDRNAFRFCRRQWNWKSPLRENLQPKQRRLPLWFGTGWHFVQEDREGSRLYSDSHEAWQDYVRCTLEYYGRKAMPDEWEESLALGHQMIDYYDTWCFGRQKFETYVHNGVPQTEVNFRIEIPVSKELLEASGFDIAIYDGTIDRVVMDEFGNLWIVEYKTAKAIYRMHYLNDPQVSAYCWAAQMLYGRPIIGCLYMQWKKDVPEEPTLLRGGRLSVNKQMQTTHRLYREALAKIYGEVLKAPKENIDFLNYLAEVETADNDGFVCRDRIYRNEHSLQAEGTKILLEMEDMLNPDLPLYPSPSRQCNVMCDMREVCISLDDGSDWEDQLDMDFEKREEERGKDPWRQLLRHQMPPKEMELQLQELPRQL